MNKDTEHLRPSFPSTAYKNDIARVLNRIVCESSRLSIPKTGRMVSSFSRLRVMIFCQRSFSFIIVDFKKSFKDHRLFRIFYRTFILKQFFFKICAQKASFLKLCLCDSNDLPSHDHRFFLRSSKVPSLLK